MVMVTALTAGCAVLASSRVGAELARMIPIWVLIGVNGFRLPLELLMQRAADEGVMPAQMSFEGLNFDIFTGAAALLAALWLRFGAAPKWLPRLWNAIGFGLLITIVTIAVLSMPTPLRTFTQPPGQYLDRSPAVRPAAGVPRADSLH